MNIELTPEQAEFIERAIASGQYASAEEVLSQVWAIGAREVKKSIIREIELKRLQNIRERDIAQVQQEDSAELVERASEFVDAIANVRRRSQQLRKCFGELID